MQAGQTATQARNTSRPPQQPASHLPPWSPGTRLGMVSGGIYFVLGT